MSFNISSQILLNMWPLSFSLGTILIMKSGDICEVEHLWKKKQFSDSIKSQIWALWRTDWKDELLQRVVDAFIPIYLFLLCLCVSVTLQARDWSNLKLHPPECYCFDFLGGVIFLKKVLGVNSICHTLKLDIYWFIFL